MARREPKRRREILAFIVSYAADHRGNSPSGYEIAAHFGIRQPSAYGHIVELEAHGYVERKDGKVCIVGAEFSAPY